METSSPPWGSHPRQSPASVVREHPTLLIPSRPGATAAASDGAGAPGQALGTHSEPATPPAFEELRAF